MSVHYYDTADLVATVAARQTVAVLEHAIKTHGRAIWVLAGGSSPMLAYREMVDHYADKLDWSKVFVLIGDERFVPLNDSASNWGSVMQVFHESTKLSAVTKIEPKIFETVALTATDYEEKIKSLSIKHFDSVWLGVGEDGHTLSLFPDNSAFTQSTDRWVVPVYDSPKPPSERISLSLTALKQARNVVIFATGSAKREALYRAHEDGILPIAVVARTAEENGANVQWLYDAEAWSDSIPRP